MKLTNGRCYMGRFPSKEDLHKSLHAFCIEQSINLGVLNVIGAVSSLAIGYYDQIKKKYCECARFEKKMEITACLGNISLKDEQVFIHAHITCADFSGACFGGHLMPGTTIFAAEYWIQELQGSVFRRFHDEQTGLSLWPLE